MLTDTIFTDITVDEVKKILAISKYGNDVWKANDDDDKEERDENGRILIKSKHRILQKRFNNLANLD